ncbi:MAG: WG repeat-containing protein [Flavobacteriaceae bacterium]|nr:WG repeat-containing protein [Flavobacteriaceae bacterium]
MKGVMMKNKVYQIISILLTVNILFSIASITPTYASIYREEDLEIIWLDKDYNEIEDFYEGLAGVRKGNKYGCIN